MGGRGEGGRLRRELPAEVMGGVPAIPAPPPPSPTSPPPTPNINVIINKRCTPPPPTMQNSAHLLPAPPPRASPTRHSKSGPCCRVTPGVFLLLSPGFLSAQTQLSLLPTAFLSSTDEIIANNRTLETGVPGPMGGSPQGTWPLATDSVKKKSKLEGALNKFVPHPQPSPPHRRNGRRRRHRPSGAYPGWPCVAPVGLLRPRRAAGSPRGV